jgi:RNA polymerase sigma factor (TIGR02999 family)
MVKGTILSITKRPFSLTKEVHLPDQTDSSNEITGMLQSWGRDDSVIPEELFPLVYDELRKQAHNFLRHERPGHTLQTTALINETYLKLREQRNPEWESRAHFFAICATLMRRILVDYAKTRHRAKRGGKAEMLPLDGLALAVAQESDVDLLALDQVLNRLEQLDAQQARIVELRYFSGLSIEQTADVLDLSPSTIKREWRAAKAWLRKELDHK